MQMRLLQLTLDSPAANLALDEALLERAENEEGQECLRLWEPESAFVVLGRSSPYLREVNLDFCSANDIPILRRSSGGATIVTGPGCLMYAVVLDLRLRPGLALVDRAHDFVLSRISSGLARLGIESEISGTSDLTCQGQKFSGNSLRCRRNAIVYHGTLLHGMSIEFIERCLHRPIRQPDYRQDRSHRDFLRGLPVERQALEKALTAEWQCNEPDLDPPLEMCHDLVQQKYSQAAWTQKV
ncbi:MAG: lipoate--protein ligase family protein [Pirellulaceae bacterium]